MNKTVSFDDSELWISMRAGNQTAFRTIYDRHWKGLYSVACGRLANDEAQDIIQDIMISLWERRAEVRLDKNNSLASYLFASLKYRIIRHYAYSNAHIRNSELFDVPTEHTAQDELEYQELSEVINNEISRMPARMQQIFRMSREENLSPAAIASQLNLSEQTVKNQLTEALKRLRAGLQSANSGDWVVVLVWFFWPRQ